MLRIVLPSAFTPPRPHRNQPRAGGLPRFPLKPFDDFAFVQIALTAVREEPAAQEHQLGGGREQPLD